MTTDGDPGGTLDSHTNGMSEGQILSMEVRPQTRALGNLLGILLQFSRAALDDEDSTSSLTARSPAPNLNS